MNQTSSISSFSSEKSRSLFHAQRRAFRGAFTIVELLTVLTIISIVTAFAIPAFTVRDADNISNASYAISGSMQRARAYAMAHNTYVWVGFYEQAADASAPTAAFPYTGMGRVVIGMIASIDGTQILADGASGTLDPTRYLQIDKLTRLQNIHITDLGAPSGGTGVAARPGGPYFNPSNNSYQSTELYGISSDDTTPSATPFVVGSYTFWKTLRFSPSGEVSIDGSASLRRLGELDLRPTHGDTLSATSPNVVAMQFTGIGGGLQTYRN